MLYCHRVLAALALPLFLASVVTAQIRVEAIAGRPFGVARMTVPLRPGDVTAPIDMNHFALAGESGRALYPTFNTGRVLAAVEQLLGSGQTAPTAVTVHFLFEGDSPFSIALLTPSTKHTATVTPNIEAGPAAGRTPPRVGPLGRPRRRPPGASPQQAHARLLWQWWRQYNAALDEQQKIGDYPPIIETYLTTMLGQRLRLETPLLSREPKKSPTELEQTLELLMGTEQLRLDTLRATIVGRTDGLGPANLPVPESLAWPPVAVPTLDEVDVERIAMRVPIECFYMRYGSFTNYLWLKHLTEQYGGDLQRMATLRGHDAGTSRRIERQLALRESALAQYVGSQVIGDVAIVGRDLFVRDGAALGILFEAKNGTLLAADIKKQRSDAFQREQQAGARFSTVDVAGRKVSLLSSPGNRVRSFYAVDGDYHLVTTSREIVRRFFSIADGADAGSLGASAEFRHARSLMPTDGEHTAFTYLSTAFMRGLVAPRYRIELQRRLRASTDMELLMLARLAARAERKPHDSIDDLIGAGLLPDGFDIRPDGSRPMIDGETIVDSLRGLRGTFVPIPDVPIEGITPDEAADYSRLAALHRRRWQEMDPLMVGMKRFSLDRDGKKERLVVDAIVSPFIDEKYGDLASILGPPTRQRLARNAGDVILAQAVVQGGAYGVETGLHHLFLGVHDNPSTLPIEALSGGIMQTIRLLRSVPGYLGAWPKPGALDLLLPVLTQPVDENGFTQLPLGLWRRQFGDFSVLSFQRPVLEKVTGQMHFEQADTAAQVRVEVADLTETQLAGLIHQISYSRALQSSAGNARFLHTLSQQFQIDRAQAPSAARRLLDVKLLCALGGQYELSEHPSGLSTWLSDAWPKSAPVEVPDDYRAPLLVWFRGLDAELSQLEDKIVLHVETDMKLPPAQRKGDLPVFNLFGRRAGNGSKEAAKKHGSLPEPAAERASETP